MRSCSALRHRFAERVPSGSIRPHRTLEYRAGRRTDHQTQAAQTPDVWTCQPRSAASARAACGLIFSNSIWQHVLPWLKRASGFTCSLLSYWERTRTATTFLLPCFLIFFLFCKLYTIPISKSWGEPRGREAIHATRGILPDPASAGRRRASSMASLWKAGSTMMGWACCSNSAWFRHQGKPARPLPRQVGAEKWSGLDLNT